ncbi:hypothetical protein TRICHSKD4_5862 [Roseibium sp. TrichSKD4]|nr:hypothetical protein TRICHSKD4_5862 [Roseibium sp. TrichSKD4]
MPFGKTNVGWLALLTFVKIARKTTVQPVMKLKYWTVETRPVHPDKLRAFC